MTDEYDGFSKAYSISPIDPFKEYTQSLLLSDKDWLKQRISALERQAHVLGRQYCGSEASRMRSILAKLEKAEQAK